MNSDTSATPEDFKDAIHKLLLEKHFGIEEATNKQRKHTPTATTNQLELALTVLLVDLASSDQTFDQQEYTVIVYGLMRLFGTQKHDVSTLVNQAQNQLRNMRGIERFGSLLKDNLSIDQREAIMEIVEDLIHSDGEVDEFEVYLRHKLMGLLGVTKCKQDRSEDSVS